MSDIVWGNPNDNLGPTGAAIGFVEEGWDFFEEKAILFSNRALALIEQLAFVPQVQPTTFHVEFPQLNGLTAFTAPTRPTLPAITPATIAIPEAPADALPTAPALGTAPAFDVATPAPISLPVQPGNLDAQRPGEAPELTTLVLPELPSLALPDDPVFLAVSEIAAPALNFASFTGADPGDVPVLPALAGIGFTEQDYTPAVINEMTPAIRTALATGQLLDAPIEQALFQRARERIAKVNRAAFQQVDEEFHGRGFKLPPGAWAAMREEQRAKAQDEIFDVNREQSLTRYQEAVKNVQFAIVQGIALEQVLINQHDAIMARSLQGARLMLDVHLGLYNAQVAGYNAAVERYKADASVFRELLQAEIAKVEAYKAQVDGQRALAETNRAIAETYDAQVRATMQVVELYRAQISGVQAQADIERTRIEAYRATVEGYSAQVRAHETEWNGYRAAVDAQVAGLKGYEIGVNAYGARVNAYSTVERAKSDRFESQVKAAGIGLDRYRARISGTLAQIQGEGVRIQALSAQSDAIARMYQADGQIEVSRNDANTRAFQALVAYHEARANAGLREAEIKIQDAARLLTAQIEATRGAANALAQLAASAMSAVNFSAAVSGSGSESTGYNYSLSKSQAWSWSGELPDGTAPVF